MSRTGAAGEAGPGLLGRLTRAGEVLLRLPRRGAALLLVAWMGLISWFSSWPARAVPGIGPDSLVTNLGHAPLFGLLALWAGLALPRQGTWPRLDLRARAWIVGCVGLFGVLDELHQHLGGRGRDFSLFDVLTDVTGAWCLLAIAAYLRAGGGNEAGVVLRLLASALACVAAGALATWGPQVWPRSSWL